jgi:threonine dehydrogenase-like Zn-dependent dehydrogenase
MTMRGTVLYGARDVRYEEVPEPKILKPTDAIIRLAATCVCGSDLWSYRGINEVKQPMYMGHEYCGVVEEVGSDVKTVKPGQFVVGSFCLSDNTCPHCTFGYQSACEQREFMTGAQAPYARVALADGTLIATPGMPSDEMIPHLLATSDVLGTGWFAAEAASVKPGATVVVVGDGAVGLLAALSAKQQGAERVIVMSRHEKRQSLAKEFGQRTSSRHAAMKMSPPSRNSRKASGLIACWNASACRNPCIRQSVPAGPAGTLASSVFLTI